MIENIGFLGAFLLAACGVPLAWESYKTGKSNINTPFLWTWFIGEIVTLAYIMLKHGLDLPLIANYSGNILLISVVLRYKYFPREK